MDFETFFYPTSYTVINYPLKTIFTECTQKGKTNTKPNAAVVNTYVLTYFMQQVPSGETY